jgi:hypothetical protein
LAQWTVRRAPAGSSGGADAAETALWDHVGPQFSGFSHVSPRKRAKSVSLDAPRRRDEPVLDGEYRGTRAGVKTDLCVDTREVMLHGAR